MEYILDSVQMKAVDTSSINDYGIPSVVLMERAALCVTKQVMKIALNNNTGRIACVCGRGNNGADGIAVARQLYEKGCDVTILLVGNNANSDATSEFKLQLNIAQNIGIKIVNIRNKVNLGEYYIIVDAVFGIGISRAVEGEYAAVIKEINKSGRKENVTVVSVDCPSGVDSSSGQIMGAAVMADITVTFGYRKMGLILFPGAEYAGNIKVCNIGFAKQSIKKIPKKAFTFTKKDIQLIPKRKQNSNKGSYGKLLVIAGSKNMGGAACLAGLSAYRSGTGLVKILTHEANRNAILKLVPEAIISTYNETDDVRTIISEEMKWARTIIIGPGLSMGEQAINITQYVLMNTTVPTIVDADALNITAEQKMWKSITVSRKSTALKNADSSRRAHIIVTPHMGEMQRLTGSSIEDIKAAPLEYAKNFARKYKVICVLKDARTVVSDGKEVYINTSGNSGMATGGSGDVLTGIIAGLISNGMDEYMASAMGVYVHGLAGDYAAEENGEYGMKATDIINNIKKAIFNNRSY